MYDTTYGGIMGWARSELEHVGRIVAVQDRDLQYSYALSVVNSMAHLKDALFQMVNDPVYTDRKQDLLTVHGQVIRTMQHRFGIFISMSGRFGPSTRAMFSVH